MRNHVGNFMDQGDLFKVYIDEVTNEIVVDCFPEGQLNSFVQELTYEELDHRMASKVEQLILTKSPNV